MWCSFRHPQFSGERSQIIEVGAIPGHAVFANGEVPAVAFVDSMACQCQPGYFDCNGLAAGGLNGLLCSLVNEKMNAGGVSVQAFRVASSGGFLLGGVDHAQPLTPLPVPPSMRGLHRLSKLLRAQTV